MDEFVLETGELSVASTDTETIDRHEAFSRIKVRVECWENNVIVSPQQEIDSISVLSVANDIVVLKIVVKDNQPHVNYTINRGVRLIGAYGGAAAGYRSIQVTVEDGLPFVDYEVAAIEGCRCVYLMFLNEDRDQDVQIW